MGMLFSGLGLFFLLLILLNQYLKDLIKIRPNR